MDGQQGFTSSKSWNRDLLVKTLEAFDVVLDLFLTNSRVYEPGLAFREGIIMIINNKHITITVATILQSRYNARTTRFIDYRLTSKPT